MSPQLPMRSGLAELRLFPDAGHVSLLNSADGALDWIAGLDLVLG
jgi:hypothetical protein